MYHFQQSSPLLPILIGNLIHSTGAATCGSSGSCWGSGASRDLMYQARQNVCEQGLFYQSGTYNIPGRIAYLRWSGGGDQQTCWNAFQNIIDQCDLGDSGLHTHSGQYEYNGVYYNAVDCNE
jgi:hypothetical protein